MKHTKIVRQKLKHGSFQSNIEPDFSQNEKGNIPVSDLHHEKKKSKEGKIKCNNCSRLVPDCQYSSYLKFCMKCCGLIDKTEEGYNCDLCSFKSSSELPVFQHIKKTHLNSRERFECGKCCEKLLIRTYVRHVEHCERYYDFIEKINDNNYKCKLCLDQTYKTRFPLYYHIELCKRYSDFIEKIDDDNYKCKLCLNITYKNRFSLCKHMKQQHPEVLQNDAKANYAMEDNEEKLDF